jgi:hypothetical protein
MTKEHIRLLRESRRVFVKEKIVDYGGNFLEHVQHEKGIWVAPIDDPILDEINSIQIYDRPIWNKEVGRFVNYDYSSLSWRLKKYMQEKDAEFFNRWYKKQKLKDMIPLEEYDKRLQRLEREKGELTNEDIENVLTGKNKTSVYKKARDSARRAYSSVLGLIRANLDKFDAFVTLTFARKENKEKYDEFGANFRYIDNPRNFEEAKKAFLMFVKVLAKNMRRKGLDFEYVATWEMHKDGSFHFHMICTALPDDLIFDTPAWLDVDFRTGKERNGKSLIHWEYGKSDYEEIRDKEKMSTYVSKYILKSLKNIDEEFYETFLNAKKYFASRGLQKPKVSYVFSDKDFERVLEKIKGYNEVYPIAYRNVYNNGEIVKNVYSRNEKI